MRIIGGRGIIGGCGIIGGRAHVYFLSPDDTCSNQGRSLIRDT